MGAYRGRGEAGAMSHTTVRVASGAEAKPAECCAPLLTVGISDEDARTDARLFKALSDPHRIRIVNLLVGSALPLCVCDITAELDLSQPTVSFHLKKLVASGLLEREQRGVWGYYSVRQSTLKRLSRIFELKGARR